MKKACVIAAALVAAGLASAAIAQTGPVGNVADKAAEKSETVEMPRTYHAGGRHDQRLHEASLRARAKGQKMERLPVHAGGRHDAQAHEAAIKADEKRVADEIRP
jgi:hypothetical protein